MAMKISKTGLEFIKSFESFVPYVYDDLVPPTRGRYREWRGENVRGTLTIGYGHTNAAKHPLKITQGLKITEAEGLKILDTDLDECEEAVNRLVKVPLTQGQFDALVSFAFNCGTGNLKKLIEPLNRGRYDETRARLDRYTRSKGKVLRGLQRRRDGEQLLWDSETPALPDAPVDHPAEVDAPVPQEPMTTRDVISASRKASWLSRLVKALHSIWASLSVASALAYLGVAQETIDQITAVIKNNSVAIMIGGAILTALALKYVLSLMTEDANDGRYTPSRELPS